MYVAVTGSGKSRVIQFREDTHIPGTRKKKTHVVKTIGNYERMLEEDPDIIAKLKTEAARLTREKKSEEAPVTLEVPVGDILNPDDVVPSFQFGHALVRQIWRQMDLDTFFETRSGKRNAEIVAQAIYYLAAHRCAEPGSVRACAQDLPNYAGLRQVSLDSLYGVLSILSEQKSAVVEHMSRFFERRSNRQGPEAFYDVTTYSFESTRWGELRMFGFSKDHKNNEVQVVMGLLLDNNGIPITYELFPGNTIDQNTLVQSVDKLKKLYRLEKITVVADRGLNSGSNLEYLCGKGHDFVISYTLKRAPQAFKDLVLSESGWEDDCSDGDVTTFRSKAVEDSLKVRLPISESERTLNGKRGRPRMFMKRRYR